MSDVIDEANDLADALRDDALKAVTALVPEERPDLDEEVECSSCGEIVEKKRARLGFDLCYDCASWAEKSSKQYNRRRTQEYED